jgi:hypothetical protein
MLSRVSCLSTAMAAFFSKSLARLVSKWIHPIDQVIVNGSGRNFSIRRRRSTPHEVGAHQSGARLHQIALGVEQDGSQKFIDATERLIPGVG